MILELIFIGVFVILITLGILLVKVWNYYGDDAGPMACWVIGPISGFIALICGIVCIIHSTPYYAQSVGYAYQEKVNKLKNEKDVLESYHLLTEDNGKTTFTSDITFEKLETKDYYKKVENYNDKVYKFKVEIKTWQFNYKNPWINWFISPACFSVSDETLESLTYTTGK